MPADVQHPRFHMSSNVNRMYSPDLLPRVQSLLADLADIDFACEKKLDAIERGCGDESLKRKKIAQLWQERHERRASYVAALEELQEQVRGCSE
jgi:hypothetical protein